MSAEKAADKAIDTPEQPDSQSADPPATERELGKTESGKLAEKLEKEKADWQDRALRTQAEFQNFRRRAEKERVDLLEYASTEAIRPLLIVLDDFERALKHETADNEYVKEYAKGMQLIYQRFFDALKKLGLEPIESKGQPFDPHTHHAIDSVETEEAPDHTVLEEFQRGYNFKGKLLRPAMVKVAVTPQPK